MADFLSFFVIPAKAGTKPNKNQLDPRFRGDDEVK